MKGELIELTHNANYAITNVTGLTPAPAVISSTVMGSLDGEKFNVSRVDKRNIVITLRILKDVENSRIALYRYFKVKQKLRLYYKNSHRDVYIDGYVESFESDLFTVSQQVQISIICPQPYFLVPERLAGQITGIYETDITDPSESVALANNGDVDTGLIIKISTTEVATNPKIYNLDTGEAFEISTILNTNETIYINTNPGEKKITLIRNGTEVNFIDSIYNVDWFMIPPGTSNFTYRGDSAGDHFLVKFYINDKYEGV